MKKALMCVLMVLFVVSWGFLRVAKSLAQPTELKAVCFLPKNLVNTAMTVEWVNRVNNEAKGELIVKYLGGPEVIPPFEQIEALRKGVVQITFSPTAYYKSLLPEEVVFSLSKLSPTEERTGGFYEYMAERHQSLGLKYIGRWACFPFYLWSKAPVTTSKDLKGRKFRTAGAYDRFMRELEIVPVTIPTSDLYTGLERGMVEGFGWVLFGVRDFGWSEKCKYIIDHPFYNQNNSLILMNLDSWNKLSKPLQAKLIDLTAKFEPDMVSFFQKESTKEWESLAKAGVKTIKLPPEDAKYYLDTAYRVEWDALQKNFPDLVPKLKKLTGN